MSEAPSQALRGRSRLFNQYSKPFVEKQIADVDNVKKSDLPRNILMYDRSAKIRTFRAPYFTL